ncbi:uncharacterized protein LY89DRAFT_656779 [Mollisia scopiformis]|uniref:Uncharacterized protein n=1 Tax=Mollisia scopiformis TaxID=149040 RepID=A0A132BCN4_MOLSC|nr:uncharacterized protein LY89DRAFT_656779 [Mollisia scopiformis]KUJ10138.1 hypothetical protein LY89DRAFT_656779 [Mollisia scopiformis]
MATKQMKISFTFANSSIEAPPQDPATRARIRKQAIKQAFAARKQDGTQKRYNVRQSPVFVRDKLVAPSVSGINLSRSDTEFKVNVEDHNALEVDDFFAAEEPIEPASDDNEIPKVDHLSLVLRESQTLYANVSGTGYEQITHKYGFNILDLSDLATFHVGRSTRTSLSSNPCQLVNLRQYQPWSFLSFLPSTYEHFPCIRYAAECVAARVRQILSPGEVHHSTVIALYVKALKHLQEVLNTPKRCLKPEVLFATEIMAIYELLATSDEIAWVRHAAGAARLIQFRGPANFTTEFEKALFMAHAGAISNEALLKNERCFLEEDQWRDVFQSIIVRDSAISDRSEAAITMLMIKSSAPGIAKDVTSAVVQQLSTDSPFVIAVADRARQLHATLLSWHDNYKELLGDDPSDICTATIEGDSRCKIMGVYLSCMVLANRFMAAVCPLEQQEREEEAQEVVNRIFELQKHVSRVRPQACLYLVQAVGLARVTAVTTQDWQCISESKDASFGGPRRVISRWRFERWCELFGRKTS